MIPPHLGGIRGFGTLKSSLNHSCRPVEWNVPIRQLAICWDILIDLVSPESGLFCDDFGRLKNHFLKFLMFWNKKTRSLLFFASKWHNESWKNKAENTNLLNFAQTITIIPCFYLDKLYGFCDLCVWLYVPKARYQWQYIKFIDARFDRIYMIVWMFLCEIFV